MNTLTKSQARRLWIHAQKLDVQTPFGDGPKATQAAIEHLGYVQIDTINVIERCHHHILFNRIPNYKKTDLHHAQTKDKTVFEYWTHALSYVPSKDFRFFMNYMKRIQGSPGKWLAVVKKEELQKVLRLIKKDGALSIRDIEDETLVEKAHEWASRKPSKKALQLGFFSGRLVVSERVGMLKKYELMDRHFNWTEKPKAASENEILEYMLERSLRSQALVSIDSICHLDSKRKSAMKKLIEAKIKKEELIPVKIKEIEKVQHWMKPESHLPTESQLTHILSPFDPLIIQRKRLNMFFDYNHLFEAYIPKHKRIFGYFTLPILKGDQIVSAIDLKTDRAEKKLLVQKWNWVGKHKSKSLNVSIEAELHRFEKFQLGN